MEVESGNVHVSRLFRGMNGCYEPSHPSEHDMVEYLVKGKSAWQPSHPGELLREDVLPALRLTVKEVAEKLGVSRQTLHAILSEKSAVTPEMAVRLGKLCGNVAPHAGCA